MYAVCETRVVVMCELDTDLVAPSRLNMINNFS